MTVEPDDELVERVNDVIIDASHRLEALGLGSVELGHALIGAGLDTLNAAHCADCREHLVAELDAVQAEIERIKAGAGDWN